ISEVSYILSLFQIFYFVSRELVLSTEALFSADQSTEGEKIRLISQNIRALSQVLNRKNSTSLCLNQTIAQVTSGIFHD
ncbi:hypothetical protein ACJX0J_025110, partial [Zea mays]